MVDEAEETKIAKPRKRRKKKRGLGSLLGLDKLRSKPRIKKRGGRRWWLVGIGVVVLVLAYWLMTLYGQNRESMALGLVAILSLGGGGFAIYQGFKTKTVGVILTPGGGKVAIVLDANCLNIYPDHLEFAKLPDKELLGQPQRCHNDNKFYYVHIWEKEKDKLKAFMLPDTTYRDPREFANNLNIPAHRELVKGEVSLVQKIAPFALVAGMGIMLFAFLVVE